MNLPDWLVDEVMGPAEPHTVRLLLALFRHGSPQVAGDGSRRVYWRGTKQQLARASFQTKRSVDAAVAALADAGIVTLHRTEIPAPGIALSAALDRREGAKFAPLAEPARRPIHDGDDLQIPSCLEDSQGYATTTMTREEIFAALETAKVTNPNRWLAEYDHGRIEGALCLLAESDARDEAKTLSYGQSVHYSITKPAGFLYRLLESRNPLPARFDAAPPREPEEAISRYA